jgi:hypothetical protein
MGKVGGLRKGVIYLINDENINNFVYRLDIRRK